MAKRQNILFITNCELGQSTVALAVAHEFLLRSEYNVHIASFPALEGAISELNEQVALLTPASATASSATFHRIAGKSMKEASARKTEFIEMHPPGIRGASFAYQRVIPATFATWNGVEYMIGYSSCVGIINSVRPDIVACDPLFSQGIDACVGMGVKHVILSPNTFKDHVMEEQPNAGGAWKFPQLCSAFPYPMNWYYTLANIYLTFRLVISRLFDPLLKELTKYRRSCGVSGEVPSLFAGFGNAQILTPSTPEIDLPLMVPSHVKACGPILRPCPPISKSHPELDDWLKQRPTILVNLGSHILFDESFAREFAAGMRVLLDRRPDVQVLWKLKTRGETKKRLYSADGGFQIIAAELESGRVRIEDWLPAQPIAILRGGNVVCMVHHGGSNSYHEAISAGVPQLVLPVWIDTYDFASRVEFLGIGVWGSRTAAPKVKAGELGRALVRVLASEESAGMLKRAQELSAPFKVVEGRVVAYEKIVEILRS